MQKKIKEKTGKIKVKLTLYLSVQYSTDKSTWTDITSGSYTGYNYVTGNVIYARLYDGVNVNSATDYASFTITAVDLGTATSADVLEGYYFRSTQTNMERVQGTMKNYTNKLFTLQ